MKTLKQARSGASATVRLLCISLIVVAMAMMGGCAAPSVQIGGFAIGESPSYTIEEVSSLHEVIEGSPLRVLEGEGRPLQTCDTSILLKDSDYGIGAAWYEGVTFEEAKVYLIGREGVGITEWSEPFQMPTQEWRSVDKQEAMLPGGAIGFLSKEESIAALGEPNAYYSETLIFPASESSIGVLMLMAHSQEQKEAEQALLEEVMDNLVIA